MTTSKEIIADFADFSEEDFQHAKSCALNGVYPPYILNGSVLSGGCKLFPVISAPYGLEHGKYNAPHLAFTVWAPSSEASQNLDRWHADSDMAEFRDYLHISNSELEGMDFETFRKELPYKMAKFLQQQAGIGEISFSFDLHGEDFFRAGKSAGEKDTPSAALRYGRNLPVDYEESRRPSLESKIQDLSQSYNERLIHEALPDGTFSTERDHRAWLAFCQKHDYAIIKRGKNAPIPGIYVISAASDSPKWSNELPPYCGDQIDLARAEGLTTIDDMDGLNPGVVIDTKRNREICCKVLQKIPSHTNMTDVADYLESSAKRHQEDTPLSKKQALAELSDALEDSFRDFADECKRQGLSTIATKREAEKAFKNVFKSKAK